MRLHHVCGPSLWLKSFGQTNELNRLLDGSVEAPSGRTDLKYLLAPFGDVDLQQHERAICKGLEGAGILMQSNLLRR